MTSPEKAMSQLEHVEYSSSWKTTDHVCGVSNPDLSEGPTKNCTLAQQYLVQQRRKIIRLRLAIQLNMIMDIDCEMAPTSRRNLYLQLKKEMEIEMAPPEQIVGESVQPAPRPNREPATERTPMPTTPLTCRPANKPNTA